jgi:hypothetical protein
VSCTFHVWKLNIDKLASARKRSVVGQLPADWAYASSLELDSSIHFEAVQFQGFREPFERGVGDGLMESAANYEGGCE